jgi:hypothetical protein
MASYKITEVRVEVRPGVTLIAEVSSAEDLRELLEDLRKEGVWKVAATATKVAAESAAASESSLDETPEDRIETRASLTPGRLAAAKVIAFKDDTPQLLRPTVFASVFDAALSLIYAVEIGLKKSSIPYDDFKDLYDAQNIKSGTPLPMLLTNLRNAGYIDKKAYGADRTVRLTAKGATKAEEVIAGLCGSLK